MIVISANQLTKAYGVDEIFNNVSFHVNAGDRVGIVGPNGAGKSTLLNILAGDLSYDSGNFFISSDLNIGYFRQNDLFTSEKTVYEEMLSIFSPLIKMESDMTLLSEKIAKLSEKISSSHDSQGSGHQGGEAQRSGFQGSDGEELELQRLLAEYDRISEDYRLKNGYGYKSEITGVLNSMAFPPSFFDKKTESLSGGERTRLALAALLLKKPDILMLDEPTNHLDIGTLKWLEQYLHSYQGTIIIISHDRYFLDHTVNRIFEVEGGRLSVYEGNYTFYAQEKKVRLVTELRTYEKKREEIKRQEDMVRRFKERGTEKLAKRAKSREKMLSRMEMPSKPSVSNNQMKIRFHESTKSGNDTLQAFEIAAAYGSGDSRRILFSDVSFDIKRGERICIIGPNGTGKTTLLRMIMSEIPPSAGHLRVGHNIVFGYYDQQQSMLDESSTVIEEMRNAYSLYSDNELRGLLGRFLFQNDDVFKPVSALSGGERARLSLLKLMMSGANMLILDEPTNHLDIASKEVFEDALLDFPGTCVIVSHDRYLLNKVPTSIYELSRTGLTVYPGNYDYYNEKKAAVTSANAYMNDLAKSNSVISDASAARPESDKQQRIDERRKNKELQAEKRRRERRIQTLEELITSLEDEISELEQKMCSEEYISDYEQLAALSETTAAKKDELAAAYAEWEELSIDME